MFDMVLSSKLKEFEEDDIVRYGVDVPVAGVRGRGDREIRDAALVAGAMIHFSKPAKASPVETPTADAPAAP